MDELTEVKLRKLHKKYPAALYSYFRISNLRTAYLKFVEDPTTAPFFIHHDRSSLISANTKLSQLNEDLQKLSAEDPAIKRFLRWRSSEYHILAEYYRLKNQAVVKELDKLNYRTAQEALYGKLSQDKFTNIFAFLMQRSRQNNNSALGESLRKKIKIEPSKNTLPEPSQRTFQYYKKAFNNAQPELMKVINSIEGKDRYTTQDIKDYFIEALKAIGADKKGWQVKIVNSGSNLMVSRFNKRILLPKDLRPKSALRLRQVIVHEIGGHVVRNISKNNESTIYKDETEEGIAIMLEQLVNDHFAHKRAMRYFAICLATGIDGVERNFIEVYELMFKAHQIIGHKPKTAKESAFRETARAFRGGLPDERGVVYIKDKIYLEGNQIVWQRLQDNLLSAKEFRQLLKGRDNMLKG